MVCKTIFGARAVVPSYNLRPYLGNIFLIKLFTKVFTNAIIEHIILSTHDIKKSFFTKNLRTNCNAGHAIKFDIYVVYEDELLKKPWLFLKVYFRAFIPIVDTIRDKKAFYVTGKGYRNSRIYCSILYPQIYKKLFEFSSQLRGV